MKHWLREQAFHGSGHYLHTIFWFNMTPDSQKRPSGEILNQIETDFGSWQSFKTLFTETAKSVEGDGWAVLLWSPRSGKLVVQSFEKHQLFQLADTIPLLVLDVWEHAYYLQHQNDRTAYINNWWNVVNWKNVNNRLKQAKTVKWDLY
ncbi:superoxide dismutase [Gracilibacillus halophilus YIM-C55.5]|uniref:superoxide dismutase n=1 Tax=Gracilibacillus halophilus YIM-C55.5 TaxID=1308866 RepID=N4WC40_9BACI|nr:superoxide dismutase [Gracilibacillus halophilus]ENH97853.1 superoxide dismutase [Gracilibacillus halophilus YIM-C55.5]